MKKIGSKLEFGAERLADLRRAYRRCIADCDRIVLDEVFRRISEMPAERFWVSEERAAHVVNAMAAGRPLPRMRENKREMFAEIYARFAAMKAAEPSRTTIDIVSEIVNGPAPRFYLTPMTIAQFMRTAQRHVRRVKG